MRISHGGRERAKIPFPSPFYRDKSFQKNCLTFESNLLKKKKWNFEVEKVQESFQVLRLPM